MLSDLIFVKKEWAGIDQDMQRDHRRILIVTAVVMFLATVGVFVNLALQMDKGTESFVAEALSYGLFFAVPVWYAFRHRAGGWRKAIAVYFFFQSVMLFNDWVIKGGLHDELGVCSRANAPVLCVSLSMLLIWLVPLWMVRSHPTLARSIGLDFERMGHKLFYGVLGAGILIAHLWVVLLYSGSLPDLKPWPFLLFVFCYEVAAQSLSEEMFFRGFLFNYLYHVRQGRLEWTITIVSLLNVLIYLVKFRAFGELHELLGLAFYIFVMAVLNATLFRQLGGILPGLILNVLVSMAGILR